MQARNWFAPHVSGMTFLGRLARDHGFDISPLDEPDMAKLHAAHFGS
jgi:hypothetical protein